jgi:hypothetical protein
MLKKLAIGGLHSLTGTKAASERPVVDGTVLAVEEINPAGGVLGRPIRPVVVDGGSDADTFAREAVTARDVSQEERLRLRGAVEAILQKGTYTRDDLFRSVRAEVGAQIRPGTRVEA